MRLLPELKLMWGMITQLDFALTIGCLDHWVGDDTLANKLPDLFMLALDPSVTVDQQVCALNGGVIWVPQFLRWPHLNLSNDLKSILALLQPLHLSSSPDTKK